MHKLNKIYLKEFYYYLAAVILCLVFLYWVMQLWDAALDIPFIYSGDAIFHEALIKGIIDNGWYINNPFIGMPGGGNLYDYPVSGNLEFLIIKLISLFNPNWAWVVNVFYLLTFPFTVITSLFVLRKMNISPLPAVAGSLLFAFIPYHFMRGEAHLLLAAYFLIPLVVLVIFWLFDDNFLLNQRNEGQRGPFRLWLSGKNIFAIVICIGVASSNIYYPFLSCCLILVGGICAALSRKRWMPLFNSGILIGVIALCVAAWNIPSLLYWFNNGMNSNVAIRDPQQSETYGLKIIELLLPVMGHRIPLLAYFTDVYARSAPLVNENIETSLGIIGGGGFIILIIWVFLSVFNWNPLSRYKGVNRLTQLSALNLAAVFIATIGGFGTIFAYLVFSKIRNYNRISIFIAFFAIAAVVLAIDMLLKKYASSRFKRWGLYGCIIIILFAGLLDQTSPDFIPDYAGVKTHFTSDSQFINNIETTVPTDNMVFQLPYTPFPEFAGADRMGSYSPFKAYLHSNNIHWSYGATKGRYGDQWQKNIADQPIPEMVQGLSFVGFNGIYVDGYGYKDDGKEIITELSTILQVNPLISNDKRLYFFDMTPYNTRLKSQFTSGEWEKRRDNALNFLSTEWKDGFWSLEGTTEFNWRWCSSQGTLILNNNSNHDRIYVMKATFVSGHPELANLKIESTGFNENLKINNAGYAYQKDIVIPPGQYVIKFDCDAKRVDAPQEARYLVFYIANFQLIESQ